MVDTATRMKVLVRDGWRCSYCGRRLLLSQAVKLLDQAVPGPNKYHPHGAIEPLRSCWAEVDHVQAQANGGDHSIDNLVSCCVICNSWKGTAARPTLESIPGDGKWDGLSGLFLALAGRYRSLLGSAERTVFRALTAEGVTPPSNVDEEISQAVAVMEELEREASVKPSRQPGKTSGPLAGPPPLQSAPEMDAATAAWADDLLERELVKPAVTNAPEEALHPAPPAEKQPKRIRYKCPNCGTKLEALGSRSGQAETCPACRGRHRVPLSKQQLSTWRQQEQARHQQGGQSAPPRMPAQQAPARQRQPAELLRLSLPAGATLTELVLSLLGCLCVATGIVSAILFVVYVPSEGAPLWWLYPLALAFLGFLTGVPYFAARLALQYLRRIGNAAERGQQPWASPPMVRP
jgi:DNA-directed RNA polymerase subunit RPC12/RpoP